MRALQGFGVLALGLMLALGACADTKTLTSPPAHTTVAKPRVAAPSRSSSPPVKIQVAKRAHFKGEPPSHEAREMADWIINSGDNGNLPFAIVDKRHARVFVFYANGRLRGTAPALLGLARGDDTSPGIGDRPLSSIRPDERVTPAGRFLAAMDHNLKGKEILWVDYDQAISMHPVITTKPRERRLQRLQTPSTLDNRISYGCINVPAKFFANVVRPAFKGTEGIVYVLPDTKALNVVFESFTQIRTK